MDKEINLNDYVICIKDCITITQGEIFKVKGIFKNHNELLYEFECYKDMWFKADCFKFYDYYNIPYEQLKKENEELKETLIELYNCSSTPFTEEQSNRKLKAIFNAEYIIKKYTK